jgi:hypothetical protein
LNHLFYLLSFIHLNTPHRVNNAKPFTYLTIPHRVNNGVGVSPCVKELDGDRVSVAAEGNAQGSVARLKRNENQETREEL